MHEHKTRKGEDGFMVDHKINILDNWKGQDVLNRYQWEDPCILDAR